MGDHAWACDPPLLRNAAKSVETAAELLGESVARQRDQLAPNRPEWSAAQAAEAATNLWSSFVTGLHGGIGDHATGLQHAASAYTSADRNTAHLLEKAR